MIIKLGEVFGGVFGGKRGILRLNFNVSLPLRFPFYTNPKQHNIYPSELPQRLLESSSCIVRKGKPFQDMTISLKWLFFFLGGVLVVFFCGWSL